MITLRLDKNGGINKGDIKAFEHDNLSEVYVIQLYKNGAIYDLTNKTVELTIVEKKRKLGDMISLPIYEATEGKVKLEVVSTITKQDGIFDFKLTVKDTTGLIETFPNFQVKIENDITDHITGEIVQDKNFTILTEGLKALADYNIYKTNALKVPEIEQDIVEINEQLDKIKNGMYISDGTVGNDIEPLKIFSLEYLQQQQIKLLADFFKNIKKGITQTICCQGDSLTYGLDQVSADKRVADTTVLPNGSSNGSDKTRAGVTYPEALQKYLNTALGNGKVNVITRGYCGDFVEGAYNRWTIPSGANLSFFQYGTNDSRASWVSYKGDVKQFIVHYEKLIAREILRGSAVVIISPPRNQTNDIDIFTFANALERLAKKYNCPFIRGDETMLNYSGDIFSDEVHYNTKGYSVHASRICGSLLSRFEKNIVTSGSKIGTYPNQDNIYLTGNARYFENDQYPTPSQIDITKGSCMFFENSSITIPFYTLEDDLVLYPSIFINENCSVDVVLDYGVEQSLYSNSDLVGKDKRAVPNNTITITTTSSMFSNRLTNEDKFIHIPKKGWHSVTFKTSATTLNAYYGLEFIDFNTLTLLNKFTSVKKTPTYITDFRNSWKNFSDLSTSVYSQLNCYKNLNDEVVLRGYINGGTASQITILPEILRPSKSTVTPCYVQYQDDTTKVGFIEITPNGGVYFIGDTNNLNRIAINVTVK